MLPTAGEGRRVLDVGCGNGYIGELLSRRGYRVTGVERRGGYTSAFPRQVELVEADLDQGLPALSGEFDFILCADVLEHLKDPAALLGAVASHLAPGGRLVASLPNSGNLYFRLNVLLGRFPQHDRGLFDRTHLRFYMLDGWRRLLRESGFRIYRIVPTGVPVGLAFPAWQNSLPVAAAERLSYEAARLWKRLFAYQFVVEASLERFL
jgi:SAM-dependent methyltransferase